MEIKGSSFRFKEYSVTYRDVIVRSVVEVGVPD